MCSACDRTDEMRRLLDEHGIEYTDREMFCKHVFHWGAPPFGVMFTDGGEWTELVVENGTPAQAIDATLGIEECKDEGSGTVAFKCSECGCWTAYDEDWSTGIFAWRGDVMRSIFPRFCPNCGRRVVLE